MPGQFLTTETTMIALAHISPSHHLPPNQINGFSLVVLLHVPLLLDL